ncbi:homeobox-containing protein 1-like [Mytilus edulis]|uniref:homeobox-containing protein 1-like n=1 Tax=Mytilus edulis TaxID=6550 RepID=UPI0039EF2450
MPGILNGPINMFSIEQIELIRRLRNSGITKHQVIEAFDSLDRIDGELGSLFDVPVIKGAKQNLHTRTHQHDLHVLSPSVSQSTTRPNTHESANHHMINSSSHDLLSPLQTSVSQSMTRQNTHESADHHMVNSSSHDTNKQLSRTASQQANKKLTNLSCSTIDLSMDDNDHFNNDTRNYKASQYTCNNSRIENNLVERIERCQNSKFANASSTVNKTISGELNPQSIQSASINALNNYSTVSVPNKKQKTTEKVDFVEMDSKHDVVELIESAVKEKIGTCTPTLGQTVIMPDGQELTISYQRRERFTFRERHLEILEAFFKDNPYPTYEQREAIADTCNLAISNDGARPLYEKEKVTAHMILNWFANSRKEVKKLAKEGGIVASASILPSRLSKRKSTSIVAQGSNEDSVISDQSNDSFQASSDIKGPKEEFIIIKCEEGNGS